MNVCVCDTLCVTKELMRTCQLVYCLTFEPYDLGSLNSYSSAKCTKSSKTVENNHLNKKHKNAIFCVVQRIDKNFLRALYTCIYLLSVYRTDPWLKINTKMMWHKTKQIDRTCFVVHFTGSLSGIPFDFWFHKEHTAHIHSHDRCTCRVRIKTI